MGLVPGGSWTGGEMGRLPAHTVMVAMCQIMENCE